MTRRTTVNRTHRTARRKEAKTIQEARELILAMVPIGCRVYINAHWHDERSTGRSWSSISHSCTVYGVAGSELFDVSAPTPAGLVAAVLKELQEPRPKPAPVPASKSLVPVKPPLEGEIVEDEDFEFRSSTPRLPARQPPLLTYGG